MLFVSAIEIMYCNVIIMDIQLGNIGMQPFLRHLHISGFTRKYLMIQR